MTYVLPPPAVTSIPVVGQDARFPVRRIFCVGRNYAEHAKEMGADTREPPFFFTKPADAIVTQNAAIAWPAATQDLHHEAELVVALQSGGRDIPLSSALEHVFGYAAGNDLTRRDLQAEAKAMRRPWDMSKGFDHSAPVGALTPAMGAMTKGAIRCWVDGELRQSGDLSEMIWTVAEVIAHLSGLVELAAGDLIFTGTPAGVGPILAGQTVRVEIEGLGAVETRIG